MPMDYGIWTIGVKTVRSRPADRHGGFGSMNQQPVRAELVGGTIWIGELERTIGGDGAAADRGPVCLEVGLSLHVIVVVGLAVSAQDRLLRGIDLKLHYDTSDRGDCERCRWRIYRARAIIDHAGGYGVAAGGQVAPDHSIGRSCILPDQGLAIVKLHTRNRMAIRRDLGCQGNVSWRYGEAAIYWRSQRYVRRNRARGGNRIVYFC